MKIKQLLIFLIFSALISTQQINISATCSCQQIFTEVECVRQSDCLWNAIKKLCLISSTAPTNPTEKIVTYCDQYITQEVCAIASPCEWNGTICTHFTGCTAYTFPSNDECQKVSTRCLTDGFHCVEKADCSTYKTSTACKINKDEKYCYWNPDEAAQVKCFDVNECIQLPNTLNSDALCRAQLDKCTAKASGGCVESGIKCEDQVSEIGCVTNKERTQVCYWTSSKCYDKTCDNAAISLNTDLDCIDFLSTCTTKQGGGCVTRTFCEAVTIQTACVKDNTGADCFWNGTGCVNKTCANALTSNKTNESCQTYLSKCITTGAGCVDNTGCEAANIKDACDKTLNGTKCHWDGMYCKVKTCLNAGSSYKGHDQCTAYMSTCTANKASGCTDKTCSNAPTSINTNDLCKEYHPSGNCITKNGGGCRTNTTCEDIDLDSACVADINGKICFWDEVCKTKTCANSPSSNNSHSLCQQFSPSCTIGRESTCVEKICENIQAETDCSTDLNNKTCTYKGKCYQKQCALASKSIITHDNCQQYLPSCTLDNSGFGCMTLPIKCEVITQKSACVIKFGGGKCGLQGNSCVDQTCSTIPADGSQLTTKSECNTYKAGCVVNNNLNGCMDLPSTCAGRKKSENCEIETGLKRKCQWNSQGQECIDIQCENAHIVSLTNGVNQNGCWTYFDKKCVINSAGNGCITRPKTCIGLHEDACNQLNVLEVNKDCYWDLGSSSCKDVACSSITFLPNVTIDHDACQAQNQSCTVNLASSPTGCIPLKECTQYTFADQCKKDSNGDPCKFKDGINNAPGICIYQPCVDADDSIQTDDECQQFSSRCTVSYKRCRARRKTCAEYVNSDECYLHTESNYCSWNGSECSNHSGQILCEYVRIPRMSHQYCSLVSPTCSVNAARNRCVIAQTNCNKYLVQDDCRWATQDTYCVWTTAGICAIQSVTKCSQIAGTSAFACADAKSSCNWISGTSCIANCEAANGLLDYDICKNFGIDCTVKLDGTACVQQVSTCSSTDPANCVSSDQGFCHLVNGVCVLSSQNLIQPNTNSCSKIIGTRLTASYCKAIGLNGTTCSTNVQQNSCIELKQNCSEYSLVDCYSSQVGFCTIYNNQCTEYNPNTHNCLGIKFYGFTNNYNDYHCKKINKQCRTKLDGLGCYNLNQSQLCSDITGQNLRFFSCIYNNQMCSSSTTRTYCVPLKENCSGYSLTDCGFSLTEQDCEVKDNQCVSKTCDNAPAAITDQLGCQEYSFKCMLKSGGCSERSTCASYQFEGACVKNLAGGDCLWNPKAGKCVDKSCQVAEASTSFDTDAECSKAGNCTVRAKADKTNGSGCMARTACASYVNSEQCKLSDKGVACFWVANDPLNPYCSEKSCKTASIELIDHDSCFKYYTGCTVDIVDVDGIYTAQGCVILKACSNYIIEAQCVRSSDKDSAGEFIYCGWNGTTCANKTCFTAQTSLNTHELCDSYLSGCTVNATNDGCIPVPEQCEGMTLNQCFEGSVDSNNRKCYWLDDSNSCVTKTCENSPNYATASECETYLAGCTTDSIKCKTQICEDFPFTSDSLCQATLSTCTSNGFMCVTRGSCTQAQAEAGCVTDTEGRLCQWMNPAVGAAYCTLRTCNTAPDTIATEEQCQQYFTPQTGSCTTKKDGGCTVKGSCTAANVEAACKTNSLGDDCVWDIDKCRLKECADFSGTTHAECNKIRSNCTAGLNDKCVQIVDCQATKVKAACIIGNNGPCLWIDEYVNIDGVRGACFLYGSCKSFDWSTDAKCKLISSNCTTNGKECIGITSCAETNTNGGCNTGTDGQCIQTIRTKDSNELVCKKYTSCNTAYYLTHNECNQANPNCTSDYTNGCIQLAECSVYRKEIQCRFNKNGVIGDSNGIKSTGICVWDVTANACRDQQCKDIALTTEFECSAKLKTCSTNGTTCIEKGSCSSYITSEACNKAGGLEGACFWVVATKTTVATCRTKTCDDITNGITTLTCSEVAKCVSDGTKCIVKTTCAQYTTKIACQSTGINGICVWSDSIAPETKRKCALMTACSIAKDESTCIQANDRCKWNRTTNLCENHTCESYQTLVGKCQYFYTWDMKKYNICQIVQGKCIAIDAALLAEGDCYTLTAFQYSWNPTSSKCVQCRSEVPNINTTDNGTTISESEYILAWTSVILAYLIL